MSCGAAAKRVLVIMALAFGLQACGGVLKGQDQGSCATEQLCADDAGALGDATRDQFAADRRAGPFDASAAYDAAGEAAPPDDALAPDVGSRDDVVVSDGADSDGGATTEGGLLSAAPCLTGGNVLWLQANPPSFWYAGTATLADAAAWTSYEEAYAYYYVWDGVYVQVTALDAGVGETWTLQLNSWHQSTGALEVGTVYDMAKGGGDLIGYTRSCDQSTGLVGQFRVDEFTATTFDGSPPTLGTIGEVVTLTATFWAQCNNTTDPGPPGVLQGCIHYQR